MQSADELRIGVIGAGGRGGLAHHAHRPEEGVRLVATIRLPGLPGLSRRREAFRRDRGRLEHEVVSPAAIVVEYLDAPRRPKRRANCRQERQV